MTIFPDGVISQCEKHSQAPFVMFKLPIVGCPMCSLGLPSASEVVRDLNIGSIIPMEQKK